MNLKKVLIIFAVSITLIFGGIVIFISSYDFSSKVTLITDIIYKQTGRKLQIKGEIDLKIGLSPSLVMEDIIFDNASWSDTPEMVKAEKFKVKLEIIPLFKRQIIVRQIVLIHPEIFIEKNQKGQFNFEFHPKDQAKAKSKNKKQINFKDIVLSDLLIENGKIVFFDAKTQEKQEIAIPKLTATVKDLNSRVEFNLKAEYGHLNLSAKGWAGSIAMILKKEPDYPFEVNAFINYSDLFVKGEILNIFKKEKPLIRLEIQSKSFKTASFASLEDKTKKKDQKSAGTGGKLFSSKKIDTDFLNFVDIDADITIAKFGLAKMTITDIASKLVMRKGKLAIKPLTATLFKGRIEGNVNLVEYKKDLKVTSVIALENMDTAEMSSNLELKKKTKGLLNAKINVNGRGKSIAGIMAALNGNTWITMGKGEVETGFLKYLGTGVLTGLAGVLNPFEEKADSNKINCAAARIEFVKGLGQIKLMLIDTPVVAVSGMGHINFRNETLDISIKPSPKKGVANVNMSLSQVAKVFKIGGPLIAPEVNLDHAQATKSFLKSAGGFVLLGPVGIIAPLLSATKADKDPCPCATSIASEGRNAKCSKSFENTSGSDKSDSKTSINPLKKIISIFDSKPSQKTRQHDEVETER